MKYLMLFEAFETKAISKVVDFIKNKVNSEESNEFLSNLRKAQKSLDFPLHKISDKDIEYLNTKKALRVNKKEKVNNEKGIYCLKYWFSMEHGFIGVSGVGNYVYKFNETSDRGSGFTEDEIDYIKSDKSDDNYEPTGLGVKTGTLKRILTNEDYQTLEHGDYVIANLSDNISKRNISLARIYKENNYIYAISDNPYANGGTPERGNWQDWGRYSWSLGRPTDIGSDHKNLYVYIPGDNELEVIDVKKDESPFDFNLPFTSSFKLRKWAAYPEDDWSFKYFDNKDLFGWEKIERSDFCIVIYLEDLLKEKKPSETSKERKERKEGSTRFMTDEQIKKANIERYMTKMLAKMGVSKNISELTNLQKYVNSCLCGEYSLFSIRTDRPGLVNIKKFQRKLYDLIKQNERLSKEIEYRDEQEIKYLERNIQSTFNDILNSYKEDMKIARDYKETFNKNYQSISNLYKSEKEIKEFFTKFKDISNFINNYVNSKNISSISEVLFIYTKLNSISNIMNDGTFEFSEPITNILIDFRYNLSNDDISYFLRRVNNKNLKEDMKKLKEIESFIKSILN